MQGISFRAWRGRHYVTLAELLGHLGDFGKGLRWRVECEEHWELTAELERRSAGEGMDTATLLALVSPAVQFVDAEATGSADSAPVVVLTEFDSSLWEVRSVDERVLGEFRRHYPDAVGL
ncbi:hypothetical protein ACFXPX_10520 [Kitasatospora sp. NPDC059146]|uniref:hypothetical protein n=1 Tax=Kitasatospora sp. NPDC059146 TaxID=3346741 RepID=UPI0036961EA1